jgi:hypothetical protein
MPRARKRKQKPLPRPPPPPKQLVIGAESRRTRFIEESLKNVQLQYAPRAHHILLGLALLLALFWNDVVQNKVLDIGYTAKLEAFAGLTFQAGILWYSTLVALFLIILIYVLHALVTRELLFLDILIGFIGMMSLGVMYATSLLMFNGINKMPYFDMTFSATAVYHLAGIAVQIIVALYFTFTTQRRTQL